LLRIQALYRIRVLIVDTLVSFLILEEWFQLFPIQCNAGYKFVKYSHSYVEVWSFYSLVSSGYHERMLDFVKGFVCIYWDDYVILVLGFIYVLSDVYHLHMLNYSCLPGMKPTWSWCMIILSC
jgi:hypothetical protein